MMEARHFFGVKLKTEHNVPIMEAVRIGAGKNRSMLVTLPHRNKKPQLNAKINKLKEARNEDVKKYFVNDQLPEELNERRCRVQQMKWKN